VFLPDGRHFLYLVQQNDRDQSEIWWGQVDGAPGVRVVAATSNGLYTDPGYLLFARGSSLFAQAFDSGTLKVVGQPVLVSERVGVYGEDGPTGLAALSVSTNGTLAVADHVRPSLQLTWFDRNGRAVESLGQPGHYMSVDLSSDGAHAALSRFDPRKRSSDLQTVDLRNGIVTVVLVNLDLTARKGI
jgi:hypothetical protein